MLLFLYYEITKYIIVEIVLFVKRNLKFLYLFLIQENVTTKRQTIMGIFYLIMLIFSVAISIGLLWKGISSSVHSFTWAGGTLLTVSLLILIGYLYGIIFPIPGILMILAISIGGYGIHFSTDDESGSFGIWIVIVGALLYLIYASIMICQTWQYWLTVSTCIITFLTLFRFRKYKEKRTTLLILFMFLALLIATISLIWIYSYPIDKIMIYGLIGAICMVVLGKGSICLLEKFAY